MKFRNVCVFVKKDYRWIFLYFKRIVWFCSSNQFYILKSTSPYVLALFYRPKKIINNISVVMKSEFKNENKKHEITRNSNMNTQNSRNFSLLHNSTNSHKCSSVYHLSGPWNAIISWKCPLLKKKQMLAYPFYIRSYQLVVK